MRHLHLTAILAAILLAAISCVKEEDIPAPGKIIPEIILDNPDGVYTVAEGGELTIAPKYRNLGENPVFEWVLDDDLTVGSGPELTLRYDTKGEYYLSLAVTNEYATTSVDMRVDVVEPQPPVVSLPGAGTTVTIAKGTSYRLVPEIASPEGMDLAVEWTVDGVAVSSETTYTFTADTSGEYAVTVTATNTDGSDSASITIAVVDELPVTITFPTPSPLSTNTTRYTFPGRAVVLRPDIADTGTNPTVAWSVDGSDAGCAEPTFVFTPDKPGEYMVAITIDGRYTATVCVVCVDSSEEARRRAPSATSKATASQVFEYVPAPGQFIGDTSAGMTGAETTLEAANAWALARMDRRFFVSLGAFGGYITVGFDHSVAATGGSHDFAISGNAFINEIQGCSNEPGIVWVMQDVNGNGLPDDEWYQLAGSETGSPTTKEDFAVTYFRPAGPKMGVQWQASDGTTGTVDYMADFHRQDYYWPAWIEGDSYTLRGTRLEPRVGIDPNSGNWTSNPYPWGYADNIGSDAIDGFRDATAGMKIANARMADGTPIALAYIDFVKIQTGVLAQGGIIGEISTEVVSITDTTLAQ